MSPRPIRQLIMTGTWAGEVSASVAARGPMPPDAMRVAAAPVTGRHGPHAARDGANTAGCGGCYQARVSNGHGQTVADERHAINTIAEAPTNPTQRRTSNQNTPWRAPSAAVRANCRRQANTDQRAALSSTPVQDSPADDAGYDADRMRAPREKCRRRDLDSGHIQGTPHRSPVSPD